MQWCLEEQGLDVTGTNEVIMSGCSAMPSVTSLNMLGVGVAASSGVHARSTLQIM